MFQNNPLLAQLKQQLHAQTPRVEGTVKATDKNYGFLEVDSKTSYFIPPQQMKKVVNGDRITASIQVNNDKEFAEPETLIEPFLTRFIGRVQVKDKRLSIIADHPLIKETIYCRLSPSVTEELKQGDWVVAQLCFHPLKDNRAFGAEITEYITSSDNSCAPWLVTLSRHQLAKQAPELLSEAKFDENQGITYTDLTHLNFITIDGATTKDIDDAIYLAEIPDSQDTLELMIAIADPTAYFAEGSELDLHAQQRAFTNYLPGFNIPMLPRALSDDLCSLLPNQRRPALVCRVTVQADGTLNDDISFTAAWIESKAKLAYEPISDWLENGKEYQTKNEEIRQQILLLQRLALRRIEWRTKNAIVFKDRPDYRFILDDQGKLLDIIIEHRRIANRMVEEAMITANICAAIVLRDQVGFGMFNSHAGFDPAHINQIMAILSENNIEFSPETLLTLQGFCQLRHLLDTQPTAYLDSRLRRFQSYAEISTTPASHFGLGLAIYTTWTSPIRKYSDIINHRLLKKLIAKQPTTQPNAEIIQQLTEQRRLHRLAEREVSDWLYIDYLADKMAIENKFKAEIIDINRGGMRVRLIDNGATAFVPAPFIHAVRDELMCNQEIGVISINNEIVYRQADTLDVKIEEIRKDTRNIIARPL